MIDRNNIQIDGQTEEVMPLESLKDKFEAFNWLVLEINGNKVEHLIGALESAKKVKGQPAVVIAHTTPGKGVSFMENRHEWHGIAPDRRELVEGLAELGFDEADA